MTAPQIRATPRSVLLDAQGMTVVIDGKRVLNEIDLRIEAGELVALVGRNGAGKSTVLRSVVGVHRCSGSLTVEGLDVLRLSARERARRIAYLPQQIDLPVGLTAGEFIALGRHPWRSAGSGWSGEDTARVEDAVARTSVAPFLYRALETLSGGERQRVYLAAALAQDTRLLLLDEPTAALDPVQADQLWRLLRGIAGETGRGVLVVTHDISRVAGVADRFVALAGGRICFEGPPGTFLAPETLAQVYGDSVTPFRGGV